MDCKLHDSEAMWPCSRTVYIRYSVPRGCRILKNLRPKNAVPDNNEYALQNNCITSRIDESRFCVAYQKCDLHINIRCSVVWEEARGDI